MDLVGRTAGYVLIGEPSYAARFREEWCSAYRLAAMKRFLSLVEDWSTNQTDGRIRLWHCREDIEPTQIMGIELGFATERLAESQNREMDLRPGIA